MSELNEMITTLHGLNRWLVVGVGSAALGTSIAAITAHRPFGQVGRRMLTALLMALGMQVGLGLLIVATSSSSNAEPFDGSTATLVLHALGGALAITFAGVAVLRARHHPTDRAAARTATTWTALSVVSVGNLAVALAATAVTALFRFVTTRPAAVGDTRRADDTARESRMRVR